MMKFNPLDHPICFAYPLRIAESSWLAHVPFGMLLIDLLRPRTMIELGTHYGISYCAFCQAVKALDTDTRCYAVDTWQGDEHSGAYGPEVLSGLREHHDPLYGGFSQLIQSTFEDALSYFEDNSIDLLHIDGYHTYEAVRHDFDTWLPKMSRRGVVLLHDINVRERGFGVWRLWEELKEQYPHFAFSHEHGLGLLALGEIAEPLRSFLDIPENAVPELREFFYQLGQRLASRLQMEHKVQHYTEQIGIRERAVQEFMAQLTEREGALQALIEQGAEKDAYARTLQEEASKQSATAQTLEIELTGLRSLFYDAHQRLLQHDEGTAQIRQHVESLRAAIGDKDRHIANLEKMLEEVTADKDRRRVNNDTDRHIANLESLLATSQAHERRLAEQLSNIQARASWQLLERAWRAQLHIAPLDSPQGRVWMAATRAARKGLRLGRGGKAHGAASSNGRDADDTEADGVDLPGATASKHVLHDPYRIWRAAFEPGPQELARQRGRAQHLLARPLISVVTPVYNPPPQILRETISSVMNQTYDNWELCLVDGGSTDPMVSDVLGELAAADTRVRVHHLDQNHGIVGNTNEAARVASGEYLAFLDHDDLLAPDALFAVAEVIGDDASADLIYFDEDKISEDGHTRSEPFFKPDWSPEMLLSANYLMHSVVRRELFMAVGGFVEGTEGAQDWDLALRCSERTAAIVHIPKVLYHWRQVAGSTAATFEAKPYVFDNQLHIVAEHLHRRGLSGATAHFTDQRHLHVRWQPSGALVSIIIPTKEKVELLRPCVDSLLLRTAYTNFEIILVDNGSQHPETLRYYDELRRDPRVRTLDYPHPFNYSAANNYGAAEANGELLLFLNNDIEVLESDWLEELVRWAEQPTIGAVGTKLLYPDGRIQHAGVIIGMEGHASHIFWGAPEHYSGIFGSSDWYRDYMAVTGACMMMRRTIFEDIGGFDEGYTLAFSDIEICLRIAQAGYRNLYTPFARLRHHEGGSRGQYIPSDDMTRGYEDMHVLVEKGDPYFNPNLSYANRIPQLVSRDEVSRIERLQRLCEV